MMVVTYDAEAGATYIQVAEGAVARTVSVSDLVMVDVDAREEPVGVEFVVPLAHVTAGMLEAVEDRYPQLARLRQCEELMLTTMH